MNNEQLERIEKMLRAQLKGAGHVWWIGGYVYGQTSSGDLFIILYPAAENLKEKVVRVYDHDMKRLPAFIPTNVDGGDTEANPSKEQARKKGIYHECPPFEIVTYDGKDTQMGKERRFGDVLRLSKAAREATPHDTRPAPAANVGAPTPPPPPDDIDWNAPSTLSAPSAPPPPTQPELPGTPSVELPDYRAMALAAKTTTEFDYAAYMVLKNGLYTEVERIGKTREMLMPQWKPAPESNRALLLALAVYRDKRTAAEARGEAPRAAHDFAKREALQGGNAVKE